jgi:hypothetical protein
VKKIFAAACVLVPVIVLGIGEAPVESYLEEYGNFMRPASANEELSPVLARDNLDYAHASNEVYTDGEKAGRLQLSGAESRYRGSDVLMEDKYTGFKARIYVDPKTKERVVVFEGTTVTWSDAEADHDLRVGDEMLPIPRQYIQAMRLARAVAADAEKEGFQVTFTGHSLGGGLAQFAAITTRQRAVTFNAADPGSELRDYMLKDFKYRVDGGEAPDAKTAAYRFTDSIINIRLSGDKVSDMSNIKMPGTTYQANLLEKDKGAIDTIAHHLMQNCLNSLEDLAQKAPAGDAGPERPSETTAPQEVHVVKAEPAKPEKPDKGKPAESSSPEKPRRVHTVEEQKVIDSIRQQISQQHEVMRREIAAIGKIMKKAQTAIDSLHEQVEKDKKLIEEQIKEANKFIAHCQDSIAKAEDDETKKDWQKRLELAQQFLADGTWCSAYWQYPRSGPESDQIGKKQDRIKKTPERVAEIQAQLDSGEYSSFDMWRSYQESGATVNDRRRYYQNSIKQLEHLHKRLQEYFEPVPEYPAMQEFPKLKTAPENTRQPNAELEIQQ